MNIQEQDNRERDAIKFGFHKDESGKLVPTWIDPVEKYEINREEIEKVLDWFFEGGWRSVPLKPFSLSNPHGSEITDPDKYIRHQFQRLKSLSETVARLRDLFG